MKTLVAALLASVAMAGTAAAQQKVGLTIVSGFAPTVLAIAQLEDFFIPEVNARLAEKGEYVIDWNVAFGGAIARPRGELEAISAGIADVGVIPPTFHEDLLPLVNVPWVTPFTGADLTMVVRTVDELAAAVPQIQQDFDALNLVHLVTMGMVDSMNLVCKQPLSKLEDFAGVRVAGAGHGLLYLSGVGAVGINSNLAEYYNNLQTGLVDCALMWADSANTFKVYEVAPNFIQIGFGPIPSYSLSFNKDTWERLPEPVREVLAETAVDYRDNLAKVALERSSSALEEFAKHGNVIEIDDETRLAWANALDNIAGNWAAELDGRGRPGSDVLRTYMEIVRNTSTGILREWDEGL